MKLPNLRPGTSQKSLNLSHINLSELWVFIKSGYYNRCGHMFIFNFSNEIRNHLVQILPSGLFSNLSEALSPGIIRRMVPA